MSEAIRLYRGAFGRASILNVASSFVTHAHEEAQLLLWIGGQPGEMIVKDQHVSLGPDRLAVVNPFEPHSHALAAAEGLFLSIYISPEWYRLRYQHTIGTAPFTTPFLAIEPTVQGAAMAIADRLLENEADDGLTDYEIERFIDHVIAAARPDLPARHLPAMLDYRLRRAMRAMEANVSERFCVEELARSVGLSRPHFFALFRHQIGITPTVYWNALRAKEAARQLEEFSEPLTMVACNLGFSNQGNFSRFFREQFGVAPTTYRRAWRDSAAAARPEAGRTATARRPESANSH
jgi:AraC family transcriptional regulator